MLTKGKQFLPPCSRGTKGINFFYVTKDNCEKKVDEIKLCKLKPVKGTMDLHTCKSHKNNLLIANTSCYCKDCLQGKLCGNWSVAAVTRGGDNP